MGGVDHLAEQTIPQPDLARCGTFFGHENAHQHYGPNHISASALERIAARPYVEFFDSSDLWPSPVEGS